MKCIFKNVWNMQEVNYMVVTKYKGLLSFMIIVLKESIPYIMKSFPETKVTTDWLKDEIILACIKVLRLFGMYACM